MTNKPFRRNLKIAEFSDVHVGNRRTPTTNTLEILTEAFPDNAKTGELDLIIIAGDFFDKALPLATTTVGEIHIWITKFIRLCAKWDIKLRVLEGTPSHDRNQGILFDWLTQTADLKVDIKYVKGLQIEYIDDYDITVLYIQDELTSSCARTQELVTNALIEKSLDRVDYTVMHGMFNHRVPKGVIADAHDSKFYQRITRKYVFCGHIHINARYGNLLEAGSTDRLSFNEEEDKGHWRVYESTGEDKVFHVKHRKAWTYKRIEVLGLTYSECVSKLRPILKGLRHGSYIQLFGERTDDGLVSIKLIEEEFPFINFKTKDADVTAKMKVSLSEIKALTTDIVEITKANVVPELSRYIDENSDIGSQQKDRIIKLLGQLEGVSDGR